MGNKQTAANEFGSAKSADYDELRQLLTPCGQQHLLQFWDELSDQKRQDLASQLQSIDFQQLFATLHGTGTHENWSQLAGRAEPPVAFRLEGSPNAVLSRDAAAAGEEAIRNAEVGAILVAGGQGTRLGFDHPKGMFPIGPVSKAPLFQILFEKLFATGRRYGVQIPLYVMTSHVTDDDTRRYLEENNYFGVPAENVRLFRQGAMPAVDAATGRVLLAAKGELALSPDGHGGMLAALARTGQLADIERRGLKHLFYFQVDNPLVKMCDPAFLGYHILSRSEMSTLVVAKRDPLERVGNVVQIDGRSQIIEYSDLPEVVANERNVDGTLRLWAGSTAIHFFDAAFLQRVGINDQNLLYHIARKKVSFMDERGELIEPAEPNAIKFERFIFDLLPMAERAIVVEAEAASSFAPIKNAASEKRDTAETCRAAMIALHRQWLESAGALVADNVPVEISPLFALDAADLPGKIGKGRAIDRPTYFQ